MSKATLATFFIVSISMQIGTAVSYSVADFGAIADGKADSTSAFLKAWTAACNSNNDSTVTVPVGTFLVNSLSFNGTCKNQMQVEVLGTIVAPDSYESNQAWLGFYEVSGLRVGGGGTIDAKGSSYWSCRSGGNSSYCPHGARSLSFENCENVVVSGLKSMNSQGVHIQVNGCNNVTMQDLNLRAPGDSPNTDGIHVGNSKFITVVNSSIATGDDCISIGPGSTDMRVENIECGPGHGISIGSIGANPVEDGVERIVVRNSMFTSTDNGARIKTWAKESNGFVRDIVFENLEMRNVSNPIIIDQEYCPMGNCPKSRQGSGVQVSEVTFSNIDGTSRSEDAITLRCSWTKPCQGIKLQNINLISTNNPATSNCQNAQVLYVGHVSPKCYQLHLAILNIRN